MKEIAPGVRAETGFVGCNNACIVTGEGLVHPRPLGDSLRDNRFTRPARFGCSAWREMGANR